MYIFYACVEKEKSVHVHVKKWTWPVLVLDSSNIIFKLFHRWVVKRPHLLQSTDMSTHCVVYTVVCAANVREYKLYNVRGSSLPPTRRECSEVGCVE